jgi:hypothetical protein
MAPLRMETRTDFNEPSDSPLRSYEPAVGKHHSRDVLEKRGLPRPVEAEQSDRLTLVDFQAYVMQGVKLLRKITLPPRSKPNDGLLNRAGMAKYKLLAYVADLNGN